MLSQLLRRWRGTPDEIALKVHSAGLVRTAQIISAMLREPPPTNDELPPWIESILASVLARLCAYDAPLPAALDGPTIERTTGFIAGMPPSTRQELQSLLVLIEVAPLVLGPRRRRFTQLSDEERDASLRGWETSRIPARKGGFQAIKSVAMMAYWTAPAAWGPIGYSIASNPGVPQERREEWRAIEEGATDEQ